MVIFQWLVVEVLAASPAQVGTAQMAVTLPSLLFLLLGGAAADRFEPRRVLATVHVAAALAVVALVAALVLDALSFSWILVYAFAVGTAQAFGLPSRDTLLSKVVTGRMSRAVTGATMSQHAGQLTGALLAGLVSWVGGVPVLGLQALLLLGGVWPITRLPGRAPDAPRPALLSLRDLGAGLVEVAGSPVLRPVLFMAVSIGLFFVGPYLVMLPLLVRDVYGGGAAEMSVLAAMFPLGSVLGGIAIVFVGGIERNGLALVLGHIFGAFCIVVIAAGLPFWGTVLAVLGWGVAGALFINAGRTLFQENASGAHRARVLSVYTLGVMGGGPIGSLASGFLVPIFGLHGTLAFVAGCALTVTLVVVIATKLVSLR